MRSRFALDVADAQLMVEAGIAYAAGQNWAIAVAIVDDSGTPILAYRMDEASPASFAIAIEKARSAALIGLATKTMEAMVSERPALVTMPGRVAVEGGLPILHEAQRVGGIGVSGVRSDQDTAVASAALSALQPD